MSQATELNQISSKAPMILAQEFENSADGKVQYIYEVIREFANTDEMSSDMRAMQV